MPIIIHNPHYHLYFDALAIVLSVSMTFVLHKWRLQQAADKIDAMGNWYVFAVVMGVGIGGYSLGTLNLWFSGVEAIGRSILGTFFGAIVGAELFKFKRKIHGSTGLLFVPAFTITVVIGRLGCFASGLRDNTHGVITTSIFGHDFGDGLLRHPVQLYESAAMLVFLIFSLICLKLRNAIFMRYGFYMLAFWYGFQRFIWEFCNRLHFVFHE